MGEDQTELLFREERKVPVERDFGEKATMVIRLNRNTEFTYDVSITSWSGEIVDTVPSEAEVLEGIQEGLKAACDRLKSLGYDVLSPSWNSRALLRAG
jgi:hypothetical protein